MLPIARSMPSNASGVSSSTVCFLPLNSIVLPAQRAEARNVIFSCGKSRSSSMLRMSWPTAPVAPTMAIVSNTGRISSMRIVSETYADWKIDEPYGWFAGSDAVDSV